MKSKEKFRHEQKYLISKKDQSLIRQRLREIMTLDKHVQNQNYTIRSLYFDDYWNSSYEEKQAGILVRKKYRIRIYNFSDNVIRLERKRKYGAQIYKEDAPLTREEFYQILDGDYDFLLKSPHPLCREFYVECKVNIMRPRTIVDYEREPWVMDEGTVRVTFDENVRAAVGSFDIFNPNLSTLEVIEPDKLVMEVKFTEFYPDIIKEIIPTDATEYTAVSKYVLCYDKSNYKHSFTSYWYDGE
ncbi:polyphosphate polymerase domain-containing protein [Streptococcus caballi]|uniref:polyphosphate polymerase domain-containing protein n=1 Tax=Streptococcus caballi TaxID=439220 RepID=UPI000373813D|nr:polyphosphate polymerase domain-containing protein [Streptococcus caballi]